ncbi:hypothetical protein Tco_1086253, partial [Tanacetum coccineum]
VGHLLCLKRERYPWLVRLRHHISPTNFGANDIGPYTVPPRAVTTSQRCGCREAVEKKIRRCVCVKTIPLV